MSPEQVKHYIETAHCATDRIVNLADLLLGPVNSPNVEYRIQNGRIMRGQYVANTPACAIQYVYGDMGTSVIEHVHCEKEWIIILKGKVKHNDRFYGPGDDMVFAPFQAHSMDFIEDTIMLCVTVPASSSFPRMPDVV